MTINARMISVAGIMSMCITTVVAMENKGNTQDIVDIRTFGLEFQHNRRDEGGNTFWHQLARVSACLSDWSEVENHKEKFKQYNNNWLPNPCIVNNDGKTARQETKAVFKKTGNPVAGLLVDHLKQTEFAFLNKMALKINREQTAIAQHLEFPEEQQNK
ncbi:MAG TPA: hypothetical protein VKR54_02400 [Candidatus Babeliales bacterium]|nr:hypothetical protein [Candidatus Babeliales bacterium]